MTTLQHTDIAIVGGGMVGSTLALMLAGLNKDWRVTVLEAAPAAATTAEDFDARSTAIAAGSQQILQQLQLWPALAARAAAIETIHVSRRHWPGSCLLEAADLQRPALGYVLENRHLGACLQQALAAQTQIEIRQPATVASAAANPQGYRLQLASANDKSAIQTRLLVVADGVNSALGQQLGISSQRKDYRQTAVIANVGFSQPHRQRAFERFTADGPIAMLPLLPQAAEPHRASLVWCVPPSRADDLLQLDEARFLRQLQQQFGGRLGTLQRVGQRLVYPLQQTLAGEQVRRGLVLMGNAAHTLHPVAGQGFNLALRDAWRLRRALASSANPGELQSLQCYLQQQQADQQATLLFTDQLISHFTGTATLATAPVLTALMGLDAVAPARRAFARFASGCRDGVAAGF